MPNLHHSASARERIRRLASGLSPPYGRKIEGGITWIRSPH